MDWRVLVMVGFWNTLAAHGFILVSTDSDFERLLQ
jgi:hypothetical protein